MAQKLTHRDRVGVDALAADPAGQIRLDGRVEIDLALGDELQNRRGDKGFGDAGGADMGLRREPGFRVDVGVAGRGRVNRRRPGRRRRRREGRLSTTTWSARRRRRLGWAWAHAPVSVSEKKNGTDRCDAH